MGGHGHAIVKCKYCDTLIRQCRCLGPKPTIYETCARCQRLIAAGQPLIPVMEQAKRIICGVVSMAGPHGEPLACAYPPGHEGDHSWATLPSWVPGNPESTESNAGPLPVAYSAEVEELIQGAIESTDGTPRTTRLRKALEAFEER